MSGSGGVSVRAGASPRLGSRRAGLRREQRRFIKRLRSGDPELAAPTGARVCGGCGQLGWPSSATEAHPLRRDGSRATASVPSCSHCGERTWIDLGIESTALALQQYEEHIVEGPKHARGRLVSHVSVGTVVGVFVGLIALGTAWGVGLMAALMGTVSGLVELRRQWGPGVPDRQLPVRWAMALPPADAVTSVVEGEATPSGDPLRAPLTGRRCLAYEVGVRRDSEGDAPQWTWALLEQRLTAFTVDGATVDPRCTHLELLRERLGLRSTVELDEAAQAYLQQRGLALDGVSYELYETIVEAQAPVTLHRTAKGAIVRASSRSLVPRAS